ncbi:cytochrome b [Shewanella submarina]|uniref:Cytochrome b n=1 Tax=Shewanella submarina TaxID=2016376 RepID=A0ABV7GB12_9GAMM|nr:cytochrome b [Shewanella submarina]MCL1037829.1 cytochrome b [Shewanella submarina]
MQIKNTDKSYGTIAKWLHWTTAILLLASYSSIYYRNWFAESDPEKWAANQIHFSVGITILVIVTFRIIWRRLNPLPIPEPGSPIEHVCARAMHFILYISIIVMPVTGYLSIASYLSSGRGVIEYFFLFDIEAFKNIEEINLLGITVEQLEEPAELIHYVLGEWILWVLISGHILAALYHHFIKKDNTLYKMTFDK